MEEKTKVLLLGDSMRVSYQPYVATRLQSQVDVVCPQENCQTSAYTLQMLDTWLRQLGSPDIVHWNNGLHDVGHKPDRIPVQYSVDVYLSNLTAILERLCKTGASIIWATTTPVHPDRPFLNTEISWHNYEIQRYNAAAGGLMESKGIVINDLYAIVFEDIDRFLDKDMLHLSEEGNRRCAEAVVTTIEDVLRTVGCGER